MLQLIARFISTNKNILIVSITGAFSIFFNLTGKAINPWDESHNAVNALEMLNNHDWFNYYYKSSPDMWNAKPPLFIWLLCISFQVFGKTVFALRIIPALASFISLLVLYKTAKLFFDENKALIACLVLCACNGFFGGHTARTGDFDALLTMFLLVSVYHFLSFLFLNKKSSCMYFFLFTGLAFFTKGPACFIFLPAYVLILLFNKQKLKPLLKINLVYGLLTFLFFPLLYFILQLKFGIVAEQVNHITNSNSAVETLFMHDTVDRIFGDRAFTDHSWDAFIVYLDVYFFAWYILFYLTVFLFIVKRTKPVNPLLQFSWLAIITIGILFTCMADQKHWYLMPLAPFIAIFIAYGISILLNFNKLLIIPVIVIVLVSTYKQFLYLSKKEESPAIVYNAIESLKRAKKINCKGVDEQDVICYFYFLNDNVDFSENKTIYEPGGITVINKNTLTAAIPNFKKTIYEDGKYLIVEN